MFKKWLRRTVFLLFIVVLYHIYNNAMERFCNNSYNQEILFDY